MFQTWKESISINLTVDSNESKVCNEIQQAIEFSDSEEAELEIVAAPRHEVPSRFEDQQ